MSSENDLPLNPTVTQEEEEEEGATKEDTADSTLSKPPPPKKRRRSLRNTNVSNGTAERLDSPGLGNFLFVLNPTQLIFRYCMLSYLISSSGSSCPIAVRFSIVA
jgi:hypothetical protein